MNELAVVLGSSPAIRDVDEDAWLAAQSDAAVIITGERGVGKSGVARLIHQRSIRRSAAFVAVHCAGLRGAAPLSGELGADRPAGDSWLDRANRGSMYFGEVGALTPAAQRQLFRFLESGEVRNNLTRRVARRLDVRVISSASVPLLDMVQRRAFREDLFYRLNVIHIAVPPLRARREDIPGLLGGCLARCAAAHRAPLPVVTDDALRHLVDHGWPGNLRELSDVAERLVRRGDDRIDVDAVRLGGTVPEIGRAAAGAQAAV